jgi:membrane fusion protein (multidrug efflux system)
VNNQKKKIIMSVGILAGLILAYFLYQHWVYVETDNAQVEAPVVMLAAKVPGFLKEVKVTEGQKVKKDDLLIQIDDREYKAAYDSAKSEILSLEARKTDAEKSFNRISDLYKQNVVSSQQFDTSTANYHEIRARYDAASSKLMQSQLNLENTQIKAPTDGSIAKKSAEVGQLASPGTPLIGFVGAESRWITANFKETDIENIHIGNKVLIEIDALSGAQFQGEVESISSATGATFTLLPPDNATGNFTKVVQRVPVKIKFIGLKAEDIDRIQAGLSVVVKVKVH